MLLKAVSVFPILYYGVKTRFWQEYIHNLPCFCEIVFKSVNLSVFCEYIYFEAVILLETTREIVVKEISGEISVKADKILDYSIAYPYISRPMPVEDRINKMNLIQAKNHERIVLNQHAPIARKQHRLLFPNGGFAPLRIATSVQIMLNTEKIVSVFKDTYTDLRHEGSGLSRISRTFDMRSGRQITLRQVFGRNNILRQSVFEQLHEQISRQCEINPGCYFTNWESLYSNALSESSFYLTEDGLVLFFPADTIASANAGIPSFMVTYSQVIGLDRILV